jgi:hypothetical protein
MYFYLLTQDGVKWKLNVLNIKTCVTKMCQKCLSPKPPHPIMGEHVVMVNMW